MLTPYTLVMTSGSGKIFFLVEVSGKKFFSEHVVKLWDRLLLLVVESPSLNVSKKCVKVVLGAMV